MTRRKGKRGKAGQEMNGSAPRKPSSYFIKLAGVRRQEKENPEEETGKDGGGEGPMGPF